MLDLARRRRHRGGRARRAGRRAGRPGARQRAHALTRSATRTSTPPGCGRCARPVRKTRPDLRQRHRAGRRVPGVRLRLLAGPAVRVGQGAPPGGLRADRRTVARRGSGCRSAACGSSPTATCPAARRWPASSCTASGSSSTSSASRAEEVWLPDSFGYTAAFPQLARLAGMRWFLTQKMSWNQTNKLPHHTFWWEGIDGTRIFTHFPPVDTYNAELRPGRSWRTRSATTPRRARHPVAGPVRVRRRRRRPDPGDAGAGPPAARPGGLAAGRDRARRTTFFAAARGGVPGRAGLVRRAVPGAAPRHLHHARPGPSRATGAASTCCARPSCGRRRRPCTPGLAYPYDELDRLWKTVLLHQFHDILPGSSIAWVHREAEATYAAVPAELEEIVAAAAARARRRRRRGCSTPRPHAAGRGGRGARAGQPTAHAAARPTARSRCTPRCPARARRRSACDRGRSPSRDDRVLDNGLVRVERRRRRPARLGARPGRRPRGARPRRRRQPAAAAHRPAQRSGTPGTSTRTTGAAHRPDRRRLGRPWSRRGPLVGAIRVERSFGALADHPDDPADAPAAAGSTSTTEIDWHEAEKILKAAFPLDVHADRSAAEIQFGHVHRPTHTNTSWDAARFEVYAHRWVHVGEPGYGVAVLNDSTYGHDVGRHPRRTAAPRPRSGSAWSGRRASPTRRPTRARTGSRYALLPGATIADAVADGLRAQPAAAGGAGRAPAPPPPLVTVGRPGGGGRGGQARRRPQRRRRRPALRVARRARPGHGHAARRLPARRPRWTCWRSRWPTPRSGRASNRCRAAAGFRSARSRSPPSGRHAS